MSTVLAILVCAPALAPAELVQPPTHVTVAYYRPGLFERVAGVRRRQGYRLPVTQGWASWPDCRAIGTTLRLRVGQKTRTLTVADCSQPRDRARHEREALVEVDYRTARWLGFVRQGKTHGLVWRGPLAPPKALFMAP